MLCPGDPCGKGQVSGFDHRVSPDARAGHAPWKYSVNFFLT